MPPPSSGADSVIAVLVYDGVAASEADLPAATLARSLGLPVVLVGPTTDPVQGVDPVRTVVPGATTFTRRRADIVVIPGGFGWRQMAEDPEVTSWVRDISSGARGVLALSTGPLLLAAAGVLDGVDATCHWLAHDDLARLGAHPVDRRVASSLDQRLVTAAGAASSDAACHTLIDRLQWGR